MQIGKRWREGTEPPPELPMDLRERILAREAARRDAGIPPSSWTLTFLEGSPTVELPDGTRFSTAPRTEQWQSDDEDDDELFPMP